jgi:hypothetical protein
MTGVPPVDAHKPPAISAPHGYGRVGGRLQWSVPEAWLSYVIAHIGSHPMNWFAELRAS